MWDLEGEIAAAAKRRQELDATNVRLQVEHAQREAKQRADRERLSAAAAGMASEAAVWLAARSPAYPVLELVEESVRLSSGGLGRPPSNTGPATQRAFRRAGSGWPLRGAVLTTPFTRAQLFLTDDGHLLEGGHTITSPEGEEYYSYRGAPEPYRFPAALQIAASTLCIHQLYRRPVLAEGDPATPYDVKAKLAERNGAVALLLLTPDTDARGPDWSPVPLATFLAESLDRLQNLAAER